MLNTDTTHLYNISAVNEIDHENDHFSELEAERILLAEQKLVDMAKSNDSSIFEEPRKNSISLMNELKDAAEDGPEAGKFSFKF